MGRIRTIKPEFPHSETLGRVSRDARLLFVNLFTIADDSGRARASSRLLASLLYPFDTDAAALIDGWLTELSNVGAVRLYQCGDTNYLDIPKWLEHQKIDRPSNSRLPEFNGNSPSPREPSRAIAEPSATDLGPRTLDLGPRKEPISAKRPIDKNGYSLDFKTFWAVFPRKIAKAHAWKAYQKAIAQGVEPDTLLSAARRYTAEREGQEPQFTKHPATWLNGECWSDGKSDEPEKPPAGVDPVEWAARQRGYGDLVREN